MGCSGLGAVWFSARALSWTASSMKADGELFFGRTTGFPTRFLGFYGGVFICNFVLSGGHVVDMAQIHMKSRGKARKREKRRKKEEERGDGGEERGNGENGEERCGGGEERGNGRVEKTAR